MNSVVICFYSWLIHQKCCTYGGRHEGEAKGAGNPLVFVTYGMQLGGVLKYCCSYILLLTDSIRYSVKFELVLY
jgi:hypothetical protein